MRKKKGFTVIGLSFVICTVMFLMIFAYSMEYFQPIAKYIRLNQIVRKYTLKLETNGGLSPGEYADLQKELQDTGFRLSDTTITATPNAKYGEDVALEVKHICRFKEKSFNWVNVTVKEKQFEMHIKKSTTSKKGS